MYYVSCIAKSFVYRCNALKYHPVQKLLCNNIYMYASWQTQTLLRLSFLFRSCGLWTLSCDFVPHNYETLKWLLLLPILMQKPFLWWQYNDRYLISLSPHLRTPPRHLLPVLNKPYGFCGRQAPCSLTRVGVGGHTSIVNGFQFTRNIRGGTLLRLLSPPEWLMH